MEKAGEESKVSSANEETKRIYPKFGNRFDFKDFMLAKRRKVRLILSDRLKPFKTGETIEGIVWDNESVEYIRGEYKKALRLRIKGNGTSFYDYNSIKEAYLFRNY